MKLIFPMLFFVSLIFSSDQIPGADQVHPILIKGGTIHTVSHGILGNADILFDNGKIIIIENNEIINIFDLKVKNINLLYFQNDKLFVSVEKGKTVIF